MNITTIAVTGGPCGGKSTAMRHIREHFTAKGYTVLVIPESATELIGGGVAPWTCATPYDYQVLQFQLQLEKERLFLLAAGQMNTEQLLLLCDRGIPDSMAYMTHEQYEQMVLAHGFTPQQILSRYDAVFHLVTAADGALAHYTTDNNGARTETPEEAIALDRRTCAAWDAHPHRRIFGNHCDFRSKISGLIDAMEEFLAHRAPSEP